MNHVAHLRRDRPVGEQRALDQRRAGASADPQRLRDVSGRTRLLDDQVADAQPPALAAGERGVGLEQLEALAERGAERDPADVGAAALPADDLAVALQPLERQPQRPARDAERLGELLLRRQPVAGAGRPGASRSRSAVSVASTSEGRVTLRA